MCAKKGISKLFSFPASCCILQTASPCFVAGCAALMSGMHDSLGIPSQRACVSSSSSHAGLPKPLIYVLTAGNYRLLALRLGSTARPPNDSLVSPALAAGLAAEPRQALCPDPFQVLFGSNEMTISIKHPLKALPLRARAAPRTSPPHSAGGYRAAAGRAGGERVSLFLLGAAPFKENLCEKRLKKNKFPVRRSGCTEQETLGVTSAGRTRREGSGGIPPYPSRGP